MHADKFAEQDKSFRLKASSNKLSLQFRAVAIRIPASVRLQLYQRDFEQL